MIAFRMDPLLVSAPTEHGWSSLLLLVPQLVGRKSIVTLTKWRDVLADGVLFEDRTADGYILCYRGIGSGA